MMFRTNDPRFHQTVERIQHNYESAKQSAQEGIYAFTQRYVQPCLASCGECVHSCTAPCFPSDEDQRRRRGRGVARGRAELSFDFYDDWDEEQDDPLGWGNDELEHLLAGPDNVQPGRERGMNYGATSIRGRPRRRSIGAGLSGEVDPTVVPTSSYFGFLERLPWRSKGVRYKPSAADLQEHPGSRRKGRIDEEAVEEGEDDEELGYQRTRGHKRVRSGTNTSGLSSDSLSSRGDIFPSEDELDDAVPIDEEFAAVLGRRTTSDFNDGSSGTRSNKGSSRSRLSMRTASSRSTKSMQSTRQPSQQHLSSKQRLEPEIYAASGQPPTLMELKAEEDALMEEEETLVMKKRTAAQRLASKHGFTSPDATMSKASTPLQSPPEVAQINAPSQATNEATFPFPPFDPTRSPSATTPREERHNAHKQAEPDTDTPATATPLTRAKSPASDFVPAALPRFGRDEE